MRVGALPERGIDLGFQRVSIQTRAVVIRENCGISKAECAIESGGLARAIEDDLDDLWECADAPKSFYGQATTESAAMQRRPNHPPPKDRGLSIRPDARPATTDANAIGVAQDQVVAVLVEESGEALPLSRCKECWNSGIENGEAGRAFGHGVGS